MKYNIKKHCLALGAAMLVCGGLVSCNDDWTEEQYVQYISFKAPLDTEGNSVGVTTVYVPFTRVNEDGTPKYGQEGLSHYELPVIVSGSTENDRNRVAHVAHSDTLDILNVERFGINRPELWYVDMSQYASYPLTVSIPQGQDVSLLPISLDFRNIDLSDRYVLPITIVDNEADGCIRNPRKNYATAMLRILPYTDFSGMFQAANVKFQVVSGGMTDDEPGAMATIQTYAVAQNKVFFYAGTFDESSQIRKNFKVFATFTPTSEDGDRGTVTLECENPLMNFVQNKVGSYVIVETPDEVQSYIVRRTLIISDIDYNFDDYMTAPGSVISYNISGNMTMERKLNTQMPEEDQIIFDY